MAGIYNYLTTDTITDGLRGSTWSDDARQTAHSIAREKCQPVVLEDDDGIWLVYPDGTRETLPLMWM